MLKEHLKREIRGGNVVFLDRDLARAQVRRPRDATRSGFQALLCLWDICMNVAGHDKSIQ